MKDIYKNPLFYYIVVPIVIALWPLLVWAVYLPHAKEKWKNEKKQYNTAYALTEEILKLDPQRLEFTDSKTGIAEFDYAIAVDKIAGLCNILSTSYKLSSGIIITSGERKTQNANVVLDNINVTKFARFLSTFQLRWPNLQCISTKLTKKKGLPDSWKADIAFKYYY